MRRVGAILFLLTLILPLHAQTVPHFRTAADARAWGEARERAAQYEAAGAAYEQEALIRRRTGDPQGADVQHRRALRLKTDVALAVTTGVSVSAQNLAKLEPTAGCYLGALDDYNGRNDADAFGRRIGRPLAVCYDYSPYGAPFPIAWARRQARAGRAIQIAWEPRNIGAVRDDEYLNRWARDAGGCGTPVFLRFGGEMNGNWTSWGRDPAAYRRAFRLVHAIVNRYASNVALVWAPGAVPTYNLDLYYPGDDVVDWVGISLYLVRYYDDNLSRPAWQDGPASFIAPLVVVHVSFWYTDCYGTASASFFAYLPCLCQRQRQAQRPPERQATLPVQGLQEDLAGQPRLAWHRPAAQGDDPSRLPRAYVSAGAGARLRRQPPHRGQVAKKKPRACRP